LTNRVKTHFVHISDTLADISSKIPICRINECDIWHFSPFVLIHVFWWDVQYFSQRGHIPFRPT